MSEEVNDDIKNWYVYESFQVAIDAYQHTTEAGYVYNIHISHILELDEDEQPYKVITIMTDSYGDDAVELIKNTVKGLAPLFEAIGDDVIVWDEYGEVITTYSLNELFKEKSVIISMQA